MSTSLSSEETETMVRKVVPIDEVKPYWRNPRKISEEAIEAVRVSLQTYGYLQPIVVDTEGVIIIGHTRYSAMRRLGVEEVEIAMIDLPPARAKELRIVDNKTHELAWWDAAGLAAELAEVGGSEYLASIFPEATYTAEPDEQPVFSDEDVLGAPVEDGTQPVEFVCPACFGEFVIMLNRALVLSGQVLEAEQMDTEMDTEAQA